MQIFDWRVVWLRPEGGVGKLGLQSLPEHSPPISQEMSFLTLLLYPMFQKKYHVMTT